MMHAIYIVRYDDMYNKKVVQAFSRKDEADAFAERLNEISGSSTFFDVERIPMTPIANINKLETFATTKED